MKKEILIKFAKDHSLNNKWTAFALYMESRPLSIERDLAWLVYLDLRDELPIGSRKYKARMELLQ